jgi:hypothetical protein
VPYPSRWATIMTIVTRVYAGHPVRSVMAPAERLYLGVGCYLLLVRREALRRAFRAAPFRFPALVRNLAALVVAFLTMRRASGFAPATLFVNSFCTDPALAAIVPSVAPIDSATLVRIVSSFDDLRLSTVNPFQLTPITIYSFAGLRRQALQLRSKLVFAPGSLESTQR